MPIPGGTGRISSCGDLSIDEVPLKRESGFTLIETMVVMAMAAVLMTLGATAVRHYWFDSALRGSTEGMKTDLRSLQQQAVSESHPLVYGAWFVPGSSPDEAGTWGTLRYNPETSVCSSPRTISLDAGVFVSAASFDEMAPISGECLGAPGVPTGAEIALFRARGSATNGTVELTQLNTEQTQTVSISPMTGRVEIQG